VDPLHSQKLPGPRYLVLWINTTEAIYVAFYKLLALVGGAINGASPLGALQARMMA